ncbi:alkene reductase [Aliiglaciecola lipolytica]|uniref:N-ethylmaleimide reductase n=1 Tax=Aliiglaciecola lipolytica E3 TaxID=1127673 RepID=K6X1I3_9ALTE|nr:alkene reductase [Aliiglaciecola lipolytica]GAC14514.1 N-ethylmaleimide reductase [Aliiglaciecola lipolytica E3]
MAKYEALLQAGKIGDIEVANRVIMAPMTRNRADADGTPNDIMRDYYSQRASAGLIIAEGTWPVAAGQAYNRQPGIETTAHIKAWKAITDSVHQAGGKIVLQIMHAGRIGSHHIKGKGVPTVAPSAIKANGEVHTDSAGMQPYDVPEELSTRQVWQVIDEHRQAAANALEAGFDGVELHCTSGYLPMQFLCSDTNQRTDEFGGSAKNRAKFAAQCIFAMADIFGEGRVGLRMNPGNRFNDTNDENPEQSHQALLDALASINMGYLHMMRAPDDSINAFQMGRDSYQGSLILNDSFDASLASQTILDGHADAVSFARHFIANPDYVQRIIDDKPPMKFDRKTLYTAGATGYSDYV